MSMLKAFSFGVPLVIVAVIFASSSQFACMAAVGLPGVLLVGTAYYKFIRDGWNMKRAKFEYYQATRPQLMPPMTSPHTDRLFVPPSLDD